LAFVPCYFSLPHPYRQSFSIPFHVVQGMEQTKISHPSHALAVPPDDTLLSAQASIAYLARVMDQFHNRFPVYDDVSSAGNHFPVLAKIPDGNAAVKINGSWATNPHSGATALRCELTNSPGAQGGYNFANGASGSQTGI